MQHQNIDFLSGGGECGKLIRSIDWSQTPIGPVENWPQSLKTCIRIVFTSRQPMFVWWGKELINIYNDPYKTIVGGKHPEAFGQPASVVWREIWNQVGPRAEKAMQNNEGTYDEALLLIMERNGYPEETYYTFSYSPVPGDHGEPGGIICANTDDTQRIIGERQLRTLRDLGKNIFENKTENQVYENTIEVLKQNPQDFPFALLYKTKSGDACAYLTKPTEAVSEKIFPPSIDMTQQSSLWPLQKILNSGKEEIIGITPEFGQLPKGFWNIQPGNVLILPVTQTGKKIPYAFLFIGLNPYSLFDEKHQGFYHLVADQIASNISDITAYEDEKKRAEALAEIDKAKTVFFSNISHEFRTPLTLMMSPLEKSLKESNSLPAELKQNLETSYRNTLRLQKLVNSLLDFSRIEAGRMQASYQLTDISTLTRDIASNFRSAVEKAGMKLIVDCAPISDAVYIDRDMWEKIVLNLLSNAFKYTQRGTIMVTLEKNKDQVELSVIDTGVGIPESDIGKVFERFHRVQHMRGRTQEGTGIGLSLVQELIKLHNGDIHVTSTVDEGSTFTVCIPVGKKHLNEDQINNNSSNAFAPSSTGTYIEEALKWLPANDEYKNRPKDENGNVSAAKNKTKPYILLADDNEDMRDYINRLLSNDYEVVALKNGKEVLKSIEKRIPDIVISDVMMPEIDGFELVKKMKENPSTANIPVVLLSARAGEEATIEGLKTGADDYLVKPFSARELLTRIDSTLKISKSRMAAEQNMKNIFMQSPVAICILRGPEFIIELANDKALALWDRTKEQVINKQIFEPFPELKDQGWLQLLTNIYQTGEKFESLETALQLKRGGKLETVYINFVYEPLRDESGNISGIMGVGVDVSEQVKARKKIEESEKEFSNLIERSPVAIAILKGSDMVIHIANDTILETWGKGRNIIGKSLLNVMPEVIEQGFGTLLSNVYNTGIPYHAYESKVTLQRNGVWEDVYYTFVYQPHREINGEISGVAIIANEVTPQALANKRIAESENNFRNMVSQAPVPIAIFRGPDLIAELANKYYMQLIDREEKGFIGKPLLEGFPELRGQGIIELLTGVLTTGTPYYGNEFNVDIIRNNKKEKCNFNFVYYPLRSANDRIESVMVIANDVTEQIQARQKIEESSKKFRNMVMQSPIAMAIFKEEDMIIDLANETLLTNIWRKEPDEVEEKKLLDVFPELKDQRFPKLLNDVLKTGRLFRENEAEVFIHGKGGLKKFYLDYEYAPLTEPDGTISGIIVTVADVTEKVEARQKVEEAEQRSRLAIDAAAMGTFDWDLTNQKFISSSRLIEIFGFKDHPDATHQDLINSFHPEDKPARDNAVMKSYEKGFLSYEARVIWPDKTIHWVRVIGKTIYDDRYTPRRMHGTVMDITNEKTILKELEESEARLKSVVDSAPVMIWMAGPDKSTNLLNQAWIDFRGRTMQEELGFGWTDGIHPDDFQYCLDTYISSFDARKEIFIEYRLKRHDGKYRWVSNKGIPRYSSDGIFLGYIGGCADIHEQKLALDELDRLITERTFQLKKRNEELQQQKDFVDVILDASVDIISVFDTERRYISLNKKCEEVYGMKKEKMLGKKIDELFPQTLNTDFYNGIEQAIKGNNIHHPKYQSVVTGRNYETFYIPLKHEGKVNAVLAIAHDNTDIMEAAEKLQFTNIELEQKNRELEWSNNELEQFAYIASHDLQEPLRKIRTYSGILHENLKPQVEAGSLLTLQKIMNSAERMSTLIYDLLNFSRLIHPEKIFEPTDLNKIIGSVINDFELTILQKQAQIHVNPLPVIRATPLQMNQLFYNLINNSLKFSKENITPVITIKAVQLKKEEVLKLKNLNPDLDYIDITVKDNGIGFDQQYAEQIFEVFKRLQNKNIYPGSGIGLALCRKILLNHQGDIYAEGTEDQGAVFHVILPAGHE